MVSRQAGAGEDSRHRSLMSRAAAGPQLPTGNLENCDSAPVISFPVFQSPSCPERLGRRFVAHIGYGRTRYPDLHSVVGRAHGAARR